MRIKIMVFLHGTTIMHKNAIGHTRSEIVRQVINGDDSVKDQASYVPIGKVAKKLHSWKKQGAIIVYMSPLSESEDFREDERASKVDFKAERMVLQKSGFPEGEIYHRKTGEHYNDIAERVAPDVIVEDDCESIGGKKEMTITYVRPSLKKKIISVVVREFEGIDNLPDDIEDFLPLSDKTKKAIRQYEADAKAGRLKTYSLGDIEGRVDARKKRRLSNLAHAHEPPAAKNLP